jgi:hypothetical protein
LFAWAACRFFIEARRTGELELLISTPVGAEQIVTGQWAALWRHLRWPMAFMVCATGFQAIILSSPTRGAVFAGMGFAVGVVQWLLTIVNLVLGVMAVSWMGMWFGLRSRGTLVALTWTVGMVKGLPWLVSMLCYLALAIGGQTLGSSRSGSLPLGFMLYYLAMPVLLLLLNVFFIRWAKQRLQQELAAGAVFDLSRSWPGSPADLLALIRRYRHWTPS